MGNCRIKRLVPDCGYTIDGIEAIRLLDFEDFGGFKFDKDGMYDSCYVTEILQKGAGAYVDMATPDSAKYSSPLQGGVYTHTVETFISDLSADLSAQLHLATKRRYIVLFKTKAGRYFVFGYEAGATVNYSNQTEGGLGSLVTISAKSIYPLFEKAAEKPGQYLTLSPTRLILEKPETTEQFTLISSSPWHLIGGENPHIKFDITQGEAGSYVITATGKSLGADNFTFKNNEGKTATISIAYVEGRDWILETGKWNMAGFWYDNGIWNF